MEYLHIEVVAQQASKKGEAVCGDLFRVERSVRGTTVMCCDGIGSGVRARIAATLTAARLFEMLATGASVRQAFVAAAGSIQRSRSSGYPYAAFSVAHIRPDGNATVYGYDAPPPVILQPRNATIVASRRHEVDDAVIAETRLRLAPGDGLLLVCDGIVESGMGCGIKGGWQAEGLCRFVDRLVRSGERHREIVNAVVERAQTHWEGTRGDDCTAVIAGCRCGNAVTVFTGPPADPRDDENVVHRFGSLPGRAIICGSTTAQIVSRILKKPLRMEQGSALSLTPPAGNLFGIDLVTEGSVTLNQVYNLLTVDVCGLEPDSPVARLHGFMQQADRIHFLVGKAANETHGDIHFLQQGILPRQQIVVLLAKRLRELGKLVIEESV